MKSEKQFKIVYNSLKSTKEVDNTIMDILLFSLSFKQRNLITHSPQIGPLSLPIELGAPNKQKSK